MPLHVRHFGVDVAMGKDATVMVKVVRQPDGSFVLLENALVDGTPYTLPAGMVIKATTP